MVSAGEALAVFLIVMIAMLVIVSLVFNVWMYVLIAVVVTAIILGVIHFKKDDSLHLQHEEFRRRRTRQRTVYSSAPVRDFQKEEEEARLRKVIEERFREVSPFDDAERMK